MRYQLGMLDFAMLSMYGTPMECNPHFEIILKEKINVEKLYLALEKALEIHPIFRTKLVYDKEYFLETNNAKYKIIESDKPILKFGRETNGYLWQVYYFENKLSLDFNHCITDGRGLGKYLTTLLEAYFDLSISYKKEESNLAYETLYDKSVKPFGLKKEEKPFNKKNLPHIKEGMPTELTTIIIETKNLIQNSKRYDSTPAAIFIPVLSRAIRSFIDEKAKNKNVSVSFPVDTRVAMNYETNRNAPVAFSITYNDKMEKFDLATLATIYRAMIDLRVQPENIIYNATKTYDDLCLISKIKPYSLNHLIFKAVAGITKAKDSAEVTYIGKLPFSNELYSRVEKIDLLLYPNTGFAVMSALDFNGTMRINLSSNYKTKGIAEKFVSILNENGIETKIESTRLFNQSKFQI